MDHPAHYPATVRADRHGVNGTFMPIQDDGLGGGISCPQIPQARGVVVTAGDHPRLSGLNASAQTRFSCPLSTTRCVTGSVARKSHRTAVLSSLPVTTQRLSGLNATANTTF